MEQCLAPGSLGDSCAETFRAYLLNLYTTAVFPFGVKIALINTKTPNGYLRHPFVPEGWREEDFTSDQFIPRMMFDIEGMWKFLKEHRFCTNSLKTKLANPGVLAVNARARNKPSALFDLAILGQVLLWKLPFRWDDGKQSFEPNTQSSCDYLNWFCMIVQCEMHGHTIVSELAKRLVKPATIKTKVLEYYAPEPNNLWILELYNKAIDRAYES